MLVVKFSQTSFEVKVQLQWNSLQDLKTWEMSYLEEKMGMNDYLDSLIITTKKKDAKENVMYDP